MIWAPVPQGLQHWLACAAGIDDLSHTPIDTVDKSDWKHCGNTQEAKHLVSIDQEQAGNIYFDWLAVLSEHSEFCLVHPKCSILRSISDKSAEIGEAGLGDQKS